MDFIKAYSNKTRKKLELNEKNIQHNTYMKQELLEHLIRHCIREVISQISESDNSQKQIQISYGDVIFKCLLNIHLSKHSKYFPKDWDILSVNVNGQDVTNNPSVKRIVDGFMSNEGKFGKTSTDHERNGQSWKSLFPPYPYVTTYNRLNADDPSLDNSDPFLHGHWFPSYNNRTERIPPYRGDAGGPLDHLHEVEDETKGAPAPPADGQGTADQSAIPQEDPTQEKPAAPETPEAPPAPDMKGVIFVNPKDKAKLMKVPIQAQGDAGIERSLHQQAAKLAGSRVKVALSTSRMVKDALHNPNTSVYLYLGKYDPESDEIFLMADKSLQIAKDSSVSPGELTGTPATALAPASFHPLTADPGEYAHQLAAGGKVQSTGIDENLQKVIKKIVNEILDKR